MRRCCMFNYRHLSCPRLAISDCKRLSSLQAGFVAHCAPVLVTVIFAGYNLGRKFQEMLQRFVGEDRQRFVIEALESQPVIGGQVELAGTVCRASTLHSWEPGEILIAEGDWDDAIWFLLAGSVSVLVQGRRIAVRKSGQHIGEMAILDPAAPRSATAVAEDDVVAARISATRFREIADAHPDLWRNLARSLADRLRQRNRFVGPANAVPELFLGCSTESLAVAEAIKAGLTASGINVRLWSDGVFRPSTFALESLEAELARVDFAALVLAPDDTVISRDVSSPAPRDNVVFELGLFMGALGHARTFLVLPENSLNKIPSDLDGFTSVTYPATVPEGCLRRVVESACGDMVEVMRSAGPR